MPLFLLFSAALFLFWIFEPKQERGRNNMISILDWKNDKKGFWRIIEAFVAILMILTALLVIQQRQNVYVEQEERRQFLVSQDYVMNLIRNTDELREIVLDSNEEALFAGISKHIPKGYNYSVRICELVDICASWEYVPGEVSSREIVIAATRYRYGPKKVKVFFWQGGWPKPTCGDGYCCANPAICEPPELPENCDKDCGPNAPAKIIITKFEPTRTEKLYDSTVNCYFNRCYYKTTIKNTGYLVGPFGTEKLIYNGKVVDTTEYQYYLSGGMEVELKEFVTSGCQGYPARTFAMQYYDRIGLIGEKTITCNSP